MASLIWAAFSKVQGHNIPEYELFLLNNLKLPLHVYFWNICINIVPIAYMWTLYSQEQEKPYEIKIITWLVIGRLGDFLLECNKGWFNQKIFGYEYPVSYDTYLFLCTLFITLNAHFDE